MPGDVFAAIANPVRRRVLELLLERSRTAGELAAEFELNRPAVSEHLQVLRRHDLVVERPRGRERHYSLNPSALAEIIDWIRPFECYWQQRVAALRTTLEEDEQG